MVAWRTRLLAFGLVFALLFPAAILVAHPAVFADDHETGAEVVAEETHETDTTDAEAGGEESAEPSDESESTDEATVPADGRSTDRVSSRGTTRPVDWVGDSIAKMAIDYVGYPYVFGGASPRGFDCSGLIYYILGQHGISIGRSSFSQWAYGTRVDVGEAVPGDLVFFANTYTAGISHVGIYIGNGQFVDAESARAGVRLNSLGNAYWASHFAGIRRVR